MGGDHHHHKPPYTIPDYRIYKVDENSPELLKIQNVLKSVGLKDPWLRNEVWRYHREIAGPKTWMSTWGRLVFRRFPVGLGLGIATAAAFKLLESDDGHGHGDAHGHGHH